MTPVPAPLIPPGWKISPCPKCGFMITTQPTGKHYCPRCN